MLPFRVMYDAFSLRHAQTIWKGVDMYNKILVPLDGSESSEEVLTLVKMLADVGKSEIILLRVIEYPLTVYPPDYEFLAFDPDIQSSILKKKQDYSQEAGTYLERIVTEMEKAGMRAASEICDGPVVDSILDCVNRLGTDVVVLATYGQSGGEEGTIGAVANRVLRESQVPVLLVRPGTTSQPSNTYPSRHYAGAVENRFKAGSSQLPTGA